MANRLPLAQKRWLVSFHILASVAWFGAQLCFLVLGLIAANTRDGSLLQAAYMSIQTLDVILVRPLAIGTAATGIFLSLLTNWGLFRYYWVIAKLALTVFPIVLGVIVIGPFIKVVEILMPIVSAEGLNAAQNPVYQANQTLLLAYLVIEVVLLATSVIISVFKPFGQRRRLSERNGRQVPAVERSLKTFNVQR